MNVWLELVTPESHGTSNSDVFQVAAELVAADGRVAASASRPCLVTYRSPLIRYIRCACTPFPILCRLSEAWPCIACRVSESGFLGNFAACM